MRNREHPAAPDHCEQQARLEVTDGRGGKSPMTARVVSMSRQPAATASKSSVPILNSRERGSGPLRAGLHGAGKPELAVDRSVSR